MRRLIAAGIDFVITQVTAIIFYFFIVSIWRLVGYATHSFIESNLGVMLIVIGLLSYIGVIFCFSYLADTRFRGITIGKCLVKYQLPLAEEQGVMTRKWAVCHGLFKALWSIWNPFALLFYLCMRRMPYDRRLKIQDNSLVFPKMNRKG